jgi:hypothetical protein
VPDVGTSTYCHVDLIRKKLERVAQMSSSNSVTTKAVKGMAKFQLASFSDEMKTDSALEVNDLGGWKRFLRRTVPSSHNKFKVEAIKPKIDRSLFFIHIPKTGGTTLRDLIDQRFEPHVLCPDEYMMRRSGGSYPDIPWYLSIPEDQFGKIRLLRGHLHFLSHTRFSERPFITTIFREPTERTISEMRYVVRMAGKPLEAEIEAVEAVVRDGVPTQLENVQTKYFRGEYELDDLSRGPVFYREAPVTMPEFDQARQRVDSLDLVGVLPRLQAFANALFKHFGWGCPPAIPKLNSAAETPLQFSTQALQMIREANKYDYLLYQDACERCK